jgi:hypothetical protein
VPRTSVDHYREVEIGMAQTYSFGERRIQAVGGHLRGGAAGDQPVHCRERFKCTATVRGYKGSAHILRYEKRGRVSVA